MFFYYVSLQGCGEDFVIHREKKRKRFRIRSPDYPNNYLNDRYCFWTVRAEPGRTLSVHFMRFATEANYDYLSIGQGTRRDDDRSVLLYKHSGIAIPADFKTNRRMPKANELWITFRSDDWDNDKGFVIEVTDNTLYGASQKLEYILFFCYNIRYFLFKIFLEYMTENLPNFFPWLISCYRCSVCRKQSAANAPK